MRKGEIENRLDAIYYSAELFGFLKTTKFQIKKIKEIAVSLKSGFGAGKQDQEREEKDLIQIRPTNIGNEGNLKFEKNVYLPLDLLESQQDIFLQKGDVLFNNTNSQELVGKTVCFEEEGIFTFSNHITRIRVNKDEILPQYLALLFNAFHSRKIFYSICTNWNNQSGVGLDLLSSLKIPVPPLSVQTQIVEKFENGYQAKRAKEAEAKELLAGIDAYLLDKLGIATPTKTAAKKTFYTTAAKVTGGRLDPEYVAYQSQIISDKYPTVQLKQLLKTSPQYGANESGIERTDISQPRYIRITDIDEIGRLDETDLGKTALTIEERYILQNNDLLFARSGNTVGKCYLHKSDSVNYECFFAGYMIRFILNDNHALPEFIFCWTQTQLYKDWVNAIRRAAGQPNINAEEYKSLQIPLPPLEIQNEISRHIGKVREKAKRLETEAKAEIEQAKTEVEKMILGEESDTL